MTRSVGVIIVEGNKCLLVKHGPAARRQNGVYGIPAGRIGSDETDKQAAARELTEESGLITNEDDLEEYPNNIYFATIEMKHGPEDFIFHVFRCRNYSGKLKSSDETVPEWVEINRLDKLNLLPNIQEIALSQFS